MAKVNTTTKMTCVQGFPRMVGYVRFLYSLCPLVRALGAHEVLAEGLCAQGRAGWRAGAFLLANLG